MPDASGCMRYKHNSCNIVISTHTHAHLMATNHVRNQRKKQSARQATVISGLKTIYRNDSITHLIQTHQQTEPRIFLLDITLDEMNKMYPKIVGIIDKGRLRPKGTETFFVYKKMEHYLVSEDAVYEIHGKYDNNGSIDIVTLKERIPVDGLVTTFEMTLTRENNTTATTATKTVPLLVDESYYKLSNAGGGSGGSGDTHHANTTFSSSYISPNHIIDHHMKIVVKTHPKSMNAFVFIMNDTETEVLDFYITTENGIIMTTATYAAAATGSIDILTKTCKDDINSFLHHFKLCS